LGRELAARQERADATKTLTRTTPIRRISYGGPSYRSLHRDTIAVSSSELLSGRPVLLLDDIARSGASLRACRELLSESGAAQIQALALGRVA
jgi:predicted amidophosphoribosyltransferase